MSHRPALNETLEHGVLKPQREPQVILRSTVDDHAGQARADTAATFAATLVDEWAALGMRDAVISPGSRSTPMALALFAEDAIDVHIHHDERSASFMALGLALSSERPVAVLCTSGTAATEFHSAVVEADLGRVPLIVLTADRPPELRGVGAPQTIEQRELYGGAVRWFRDAGVPRSSERDSWRKLAREAWMNAVGEQVGPVHLNLPFREPLVGSPGDLPQRESAVSDPAISLGSDRAIPDEDLGELVADIAGRRGVIVVGGRAARSREDAAAVHLLAEHLGWPVMADGLSGCRVEVIGCITTFDSILRSQRFADEQTPEVVIRIGGLPASKVLNKWIASSGATLVGFDPNGRLADPDRIFTRQWVVSTARACDQLRASVPPLGDPTWRQSWIDAEHAASDVIDRVLGGHSEATEPAVVVDLFALLSDEGSIFLSSSMPVRDAEWFAPARNRLKVLSNRGASGIDGVVSTAVGVALTGRPTALVIGDLAFLHDSNALIGLGNRDVNLTVVVVDNDGGGIFSMLPVRDQIDSKTFDKLFATPHGVDLVKLVQAHGLPVERVSSRTGAQAAMVGALSRGGPRVVIVDTNRDRNRELHGEVNAAVFDTIDAMVGN